jgi:hypothetical protein
MAIDLRQWLSVLSACTLGWVCGFIIYITVIYGSAISAMDRHQQSNLPATFPHQQLQPNKHGQPKGSVQQATFQHAIVRIVTPLTDPQPAKSNHMAPQRTNYRLQSSRSFYL